MHDRGTFEFASEAVTFREITAMFEAIQSPQKGAA
jgi:hypothetical protein